MKNKKIYSVVIFAVVLSSFVSSFIYLNSPPIGHELKFNAKDYLKVNSYVENILNSYFIDIFPDKTQLHENSIYCYEYRCALVGDPTFSIELTNYFDDPSVFQSEKSRLLNLGGEKIQYNDTLLCVYKHSNDEFYNDGEINDGLFFCFEFVKINEEELSIKYQVVYTHDGQNSNNELSTIIDTIKNEN